MDKFDRTTHGMLAAIKRCFTKHNLSELWDKLIYLSADGTSANGSKDSGLIAKILAEYGLVLFLWNFSYRLELALNDALSDLQVRWRNR